MGRKPGKEGWLFQGVSFCSDLIQTTLKSWGGGEGESLGTGPRCLLQSISSSWDQNCDHMSLCFSKFHVCLCISAKLNQFSVWNLKDSGLPHSGSKPDFFPGTRAAFVQVSHALRSHPLIIQTCVTELQITPSRADRELFLNKHS